MQDCLGRLAQSSDVRSSHLGVRAEVLRCLRIALQHGHVLVVKVEVSLRLQVVHMVHSNKAVSQKRCLLDHLAHDRSHSL